MDKLPSAAFRRYYAKLDAPTIVTVNGHPIGVWTPASSIEAKVFGDPAAIARAGFNSRPFSPAPKKGK